MANAFRGKTLFIDTSGAIDATLEIEAVKLMGGSDAATISIKKGGSSGAVMHEMEAATDTNVFEGALDLRVNKGASPYVTISGTSAKAYIYLK
jgi:hypothetical protein